MGPSSFSPVGTQSAPGGEKRGKPEKIGMNKKNEKIGINTKKKQGRIQKKKIGTKTRKEGENRDE